MKVKMNSKKKTNAELNDFIRRTISWRRDNVCLQLELDSMVHQIDCIVFLEIECVLVMDVLAKS